MTNAATVNRNRPAGGWEENVCIRFYGISEFLGKGSSIYRTTCALPMSRIPVFSFSVLEEGESFFARDTARKGSSRNGVAGGIFERSFVLRWQKFWNSIPE
jgi:hypothetical protein